MIAPRCLGKSLRTTSRWRRCSVPGPLTPSCLNSRIRIRFVTYSWRADAACVRDARLRDDRDELCVEMPPSICQKKLYALGATR